MEIPVGSQLSRCEGPALPLFFAVRPVLPCASLTMASITADDVKTVPLDYRFPTVNQAKHCFTCYNEFFKCIGEKGEDSADCAKFAKCYRSLCPSEWVEKWAEERANGTFAGRY